MQLIAQYTSPSWFLLNFSDLYYLQLCCWQWESLNFIFSWLITGSQASPEVGCPWTPSWNVSLMVERHDTIATISRPPTLFLSSVSHHLASIHLEERAPHSSRSCNNFSFACLGRANWRLASKQSGIDEPCSAIAIRITLDGVRFLPTLLRNLLH
jgi:hypothetical protein